MPPSTYPKILAQLLDLAASADGEVSDEAAIVLQSIIELHCIRGDGRWHREMEREQIFRPLLQERLHRDSIVGLEFTTTQRDAFVWDVLTKMEALTQPELTYRLARILKQSAAVSGIEVRVARFISAHWETAPVGIISQLFLVIWDREVWRSILAHSQDESLQDIVQYKLDVQAQLD